MYVADLVPYFSNMIFRAKKEMRFIIQCTMIELQWNLAHLIHVNWGKNDNRCVRCIFLEMWTRHCNNFSLQPCHSNTTSSLYLKRPCHPTTASTLNPYVPYSYSIQIVSPAVAIIREYNFLNIHNTMSCCYGFNIVYSWIPEYFEVNRRLFIVTVREAHRNRRQGKKKCSLLLL